MYLPAISSTLFFTSLINCFFALSLSSWVSTVNINLKFSIENLESIGIRPFSVLTTASHILPSLNLYCVVYKSLGNAFASNSYKNCSPSPPRNLGDFKTLLKSFMSLLNSCKPPKCFCTPKITSDALSNLSQISFVCWFIASL